MRTIAEFFTASRTASLVGILATVWGVLESRGTFHNLGEPWATIVVVVGVLITGAGRSYLANRKVQPSAPAESTEVAP